MLKRDGNGDGQKRFLKNFGKGHEGYLRTRPALAGGGLGKNADHPSNPKARTLIHGPRAASSAHETTQQTHRAASNPPCCLSTSGRLWTPTTKTALFSMACPPRAASCPSIRPAGRGWHRVFAFWELAPKLAELMARSLQTQGLFKRHLQTQAMTGRARKACTPHFRIRSRLSLRRSSAILAAPPSPPICFTVAATFRELFLCSLGVLAVEPLETTRPVSPNLFTAIHLQRFGLCLQCDHHQHIPRASLCPSVSVFWKQPAHIRPAPSKRLSGPLRSQNRASCGRHQAVLILRVCLRNRLSGHIRRNNRCVTDQSHT